MSKNTKNESQVKTPEQIQEALLKQINALETKLEALEKKDEVPVTVRTVREALPPLETIKLTVVNH